MHAAALLMRMCRARLKQNPRSSGAREIEQEVIAGTR